MFCSALVLCFPAAQDDDEIPQEFLLGKHQLSELGSESAKIKAMGISSRVLCIVVNHYHERWTVVCGAVSVGGLNNCLCCCRSRPRSW